jgi:hypothetical protein
MPYIVGRDPETHELMIGDSRTHGFFLRGPASEEQAIRNLVQAANERIHREGSVPPPSVVKEGSKP